MRHLPRFRTSRIVSTAGVLAMAALNMGNQSCQQQPAAPPPRVLKMDVAVGVLRAQPISLPNGETVDFPTIANDLFDQQIMANAHFVISSVLQNGPTANAGAMFAARFAMRSADQSVMAAHGFALSGSVPACLYDAPQALLGGEVISLSADGGGGLSIGYGLGPATIGGSVKITDARLEVSALTKDPLSLEPLESGRGVAHQSYDSFAFGFPAGVAIGLTFFYQTPIATTIRLGMTRALDGVVASYEATPGGSDWNDVWESRVLDAPQVANGVTEILFREGSRAGILVGDTFSVTNLHYQWDGADCESKLLWRIAETHSPIALATVSWTGADVSMATVTHLQMVDIRPGAQVKVKTLKRPPGAAGPLPN